MTQQNSDNAALDDQMQDCIQDCLNCHTTCLDTLNNCLETGGEHARPQHIRSLLDCADMCLTAAHFLLRNSPLQGYTCQACAQVSMHCAGECEQLGDTDCANACRACSEACSQMAKMMV